MLRSPHLLLLLPLCFSFSEIGCSPPAPPPSRPSGTAGSLLPLFSATAGEKSSLVAGNSRLFLLQPDAGRQLAAFDGLGTPVETLLPARLLAALGTDNGRINIRAAVATDGGKFLLYASGASQRRSLASLWLYQPNGDVLKLLANSQTLADMSGLGDSIDLADAQLVRTDRGTWFCLYHSDAAVFFLLSATGIANETSPLHRAFSRLKEEGQTVRFLPDDRLFARASGGLGLMRGDGTIHSISDEGEMTPVPAADGRPAQSVPPLAITTGDGEAARLEFCPNEATAVDVLAMPSSGDRAVVRYPAFFIVGPHGTTVIDRDAITVRPGFPVHALRITAWCAEASSGKIVVYDAMSGEIMRLKFAAN